MNVSTQTNINSGLPAAAPRRWFVFNDGYSEVQISLDALLADNADDAEICEWAASAKVGDTFGTGGAVVESTVERVS